MEIPHNNKKNSLYSCPVTLEHEPNRAFRRVLFPHNFFYFYLFENILSIFFFSAKLLEVSEMTTNIDALYAELYPNSPSREEGGGQQQQQQQQMASSFDADSPTRYGAGSGGGVGFGRAAAAPTAAAPTARHIGGFDSDDDDDVAAPAGATSAMRDRAAPLQRATPSASASSSANLSTVPFPNISHKVYDALVPHYRCTQASLAFVCGPQQRGSSAGGCGSGPQEGSDEAGRLRDLFAESSTPSAVAAIATDPRKYDDLLRRKGAFHVVAPRKGNGCRDYTTAEAGGGMGDGSNRGSLPSAGAAGGCPFLVCRRCDHPVVRHDGLRWYGSKVSSNEGSRGAVLLDGAEEPETDLYLVVRNYYPDWSRLATAHIAAAPAASASSVLPLSSSPPQQQQQGDNGNGGERDRRAGIDAFDDDTDEEEEKAAAQQQQRGMGLSPPPPSAQTHVALSSPSAQASPSAAAFALISDPNAAAYCCQCSWLTVIGTHEGAGISTTLADAAVHGSSACAVGPAGATRFMPLICGGDAVDYAAYAHGRGHTPKRRLPLWVCRGHLQ